MYVRDNYGGTNCNISHNTVYGSDSEAVRLNSSSSNNTLVDNILYSVSTVNDYGTSNSTTGNFTSDPLFVDAENHDFTLGSGSSAIEAASDGEDMGADLSLVENGDSSGSPLGGNSHMLNLGSGGSTINFN